jgi:hypothetical protein
MRCYSCFLESINVNRKSWQVEGQERQGAERGTKGIGAVDSLGQGSSSASTRPISHVTQDQSRGFSTKKREKSGNGRVILLASYLVVFLHYSLHFSLLFFFLLLLEKSWLSRSSAFLLMHSFVVKVAYGGVEIVLSFHFFSMTVKYY